MSVRYVRDITTGNFIVSVLGFKIVVLPEVMVRVVGVSPRAVLGSTTITHEQAASMYLVVPAAQPEAVVA